MVSKPNILFLSGVSISLTHVGEIIENNTARKLIVSLTLLHRMEFGFSIICCDISVCGGFFVVVMPWYKTKKTNDDV